MKGRVERLSFAYGASPVLREVSLDIPDGKVCVVIGPSGSGKSTLLHLLAGLRDPDSGRVLFNDRDVTEVRTEKRDIGVVFQSYALFPHMTARENVAFGLRTPRCRLSSAESEARVKEMLRLLDLEGLADRKPSELSGGEQQRVALARAVAPRPSLLLLDEPLSALDARLRASVRFGLAKLLRELAITTLYVTHDQQEAMLLADHLIVLNDGRVEQAGDALALYRRPANLFVATFLGETNVLEATVQGHAAPGQRRVRSALGEVCCPLNGLPEGSTGKLLLRPEDLCVAASGASARVTEARSLGSFDRVMAKLGSGEHLLLHMAPGTAPEVGQALGLAINPGRGHFLIGRPT